MVKHSWFAAFMLLPAIATASAPDAGAVWNEFVTKLRAGDITKEDIRPYHPQLADPMLQFLESFRRNSRAEDWAKPELYVVGDQIHGIVSLTGGYGDKAAYCFTLLVQNSRWYFQHVESVFIRLDRLGTLPASQFPDVPEAQKAWMRDEWRVTEQIKVYNLLVSEKGRDVALQLFRDGAGYALQARTWVPFLAPSRAFILFLCWEQANLLSSPVTLESLDDTSAVVRLQPRWFRLYRQTAHLRQLINEAAYRELFEVNWQDRARAAGWKLRIEYDGDKSILHFSR